MVGSRRWFGYESDSGANYAVQLDESNAETEELGFGAVVAGSPIIRATGKYPVRMRKVNCSRVEGTETIRASFFVGTQAAYDAIIDATTVTVNGVEWNIQSYSGEFGILVPATDTEQLDGDVDDNFA